MIRRACACPLLFISRASSEALTARCDRATSCRDLRDRAGGSATRTPGVDQGHSYRGARFPDAPDRRPSSHRPSSQSSVVDRTSRRDRNPTRPHTIQLCRAEQVRFRHVRAQGNGTYNNSFTQWCCDIPTAVSRTQAEGATQLSRRRAPRTSLRSSFATSSGSRLAVGSAGSAASANISSSSSGVAGGGVAS